MIGQPKRPGPLSPAPSVSGLGEGAGVGAWFRAPGWSSAESLLWSVVQAKKRGRASPRRVEFYDPKRRKAKQGALLQTLLYLLRSNSTLLDRRRQY